MGQISTEQTVKIIEAVGEAMPKEHTVVSDTNYWALGLIALVPLIAGGVIAFIKRKKK